MVTESNQHTVLNLAFMLMFHGHSSTLIQTTISHLMRFLKRNCTSPGTMELLLAVICKSAPSTSIRCSTLAIFLASSIPRWWLPTNGIISSFIMVIIPVAWHAGNGHITFSYYVIKSSNLKMKGYLDAPEIIAGLHIFAQWIVLHNIKKRFSILVPPFLFFFSLIFNVPNHSMWKMLIKIWNGKVRKYPHLLRPLIFTLPQNG